MENGKLAEQSKSLNTLKTHDVLVQVDCKDFNLSDNLFVKVLTVMLDSLFLCHDDKRLEIQKGFIDSLCDSHKEMVKYLMEEK